MSTAREYLQAILDGKWLRRGDVLIRMGDKHMLSKVRDSAWTEYYGCPRSPDWEITDPIPEPPKPVSFMEALRDSVESGSMYERVDCNESMRSIRHEYRFRIEDGFVNEIGQAFSLTPVDLDAEWIKVEDAK